ncbi:MAG: diaminopimelate decarboxylase [Planctomycetes bacterium]|nr:diaminopimelate decarboxylase [Planctomycetota bacterium]
MNEEFHYKNGELYCEDVPVQQIAAKAGTPVYIYSQNHFLKQHESIVQAFKNVEPLVCYSVKSNSNLGILRAMALAGSGFDAVSKGEIYRALRAGAEPNKIVFAGVGKTPDEIDYALEQGILMFNVESEAELDTISKVAAKRKTEAPIALRINPDVDPKTHKYISTGKRENKFGIDLSRAEACAKRIKELKNLRLRGLHIHIGSQITQDDRHAEAIDKVTPFIKKLKEQDFPLEFLNVGGGYGISYHPGEGLPINDFATKMVPKIKALGLKMLCEPGRFISGNGGILVTQVIYDKPSGDKNFLIVDAAMNDLLRPSIYQAYHLTWPVKHKGLADGAALGDNSLLEKEEAIKDGTTYDVVGPICESGDYFALGRKLPTMNDGELLAVFSCGAYGMAMASNYNTRGRPAEVIVDGDNYWVARERETIEDQIRGERLTPRELNQAKA